MAKFIKPWSARGRDFSQPGLFAEASVAYQLLFEFLRVSPSYELARKANQEGLSKEDKKLLPNDFEQVLKTYELLGDVQKIIFRDWWLSRGIKAYGNPYSKPKVHEVIKLQRGSYETLDIIQDDLDRYLNVTRREEGFTPTALVSIPIGRTRREILRQINKLLDGYSVEKLPTEKKPILKISAKRIHTKALMKSLSLIWLKSASPKMEEWRLGVHARVSETYSSLFDPKGPRKVKDPQEAVDRALLTKMTSRALEKGKCIAENAARGKFPSQDSVQILNFDYPQLALRIRAKNRWEKSERERLLRIESKKNSK